MIQNIKTHKELLENGTTYHSDCYKSVKNKTNIQRLKKNSGMWKCTQKTENSSIEVDDISEKTKIDETQQSKSFSETPKLLRSTTFSYDKNIFILC